MKMPTAWRDDRNHLQKLRSFCFAAQTGNFSKAAEAVSRRFWSLERFSGRRSDDSLEVEVVGCELDTEYNYPPPSGNFHGYGSP